MQHGTADPAELITVFILAAPSLLRADPCPDPLAVRDEHFARRRPDGRPLVWWPSRVDLSRYADLLTGRRTRWVRRYLAALRNSLIVAGSATVAACSLAAPAAWAVSRTPAIGWSLYALILTYMLPPVALAVPLYMGLAALGLLNTTFGLALIYLSILAPFTTWLLKSGFDTHPPRYRTVRDDGRGAP